MEKQIKGFKVKEMAEQLSTVWEEKNKDIKINIKTLYSLIKLKKQIIEQGQKITDTLIQFFISNDYQVNDGNTGFIIPPQKQQEASDNIQELYQTQISIVYEPIILDSNDIMPIEIMEILFDFIELKTENS